MPDIKVLRKKQRGEIIFAWVRQENYQKKVTHFFRIVKNQKEILPSQEGGREREYGGQNLFQREGTTGAKVRWLECVQC